MLLEAGNELNTTKQLHKIQRFGEIPVVSYTTEDVASNAVWYPFGKPGSFLFGENRPVSACWGEPQIPHNAPLVRLRILRTLSFCDYRPCDFSLLISSDPTPRIRSTLALAVKSSLISVRALFSAFDTLCPFAIHIVSFCKRNIWIY